MTTETKLISIHPSAADILTMIDTSPRLAATTKTKYRRVTIAFLETGGNLADAGNLAHYTAELNTTAKSHLKAVVKLWAAAVLQEVNANAQPTPEAMATADAIERRLKAIMNAIHVEAANGQKAHFWLSQADVRRLLRTCSDGSVKCQRDKIVLGILVGAGLRRDELCRLEFSDLKHQPHNGKLRVVLNVAGKGDKARVVPISDPLAAAIDDWHKPCRSKGRIARSVNKAGILGASLSPVGIFKIVNRAGADIGYPALAPHDLRRTYAQIGYEAGVPITQISRLLGHASIATTQRYLNLDLDLETTVGDFVPFE
jgi:integrase